MSKFALFYNHMDLTPVAANNAERLFEGLNPDDQALADHFWGCGLSAWSSAPYALDDPLAAPHADGDADCRILVIDSPTYGLADLRGLLQRMGDEIPEADYLRSVAGDMEHWAGAIDPWPPNPEDVNPPGDIPPPPDQPAPDQPPVG
jgi:hypothetical protein